MDDNNMINNKKNVEQLKSYLNKIEWHYRVDSEDPAEIGVYFNVAGEDLPVNMKFLFFADKQLVMLISQLPFDFPKEKRVEGAVAISMLNQSLTLGNFDFNMEDGASIFRLTNSFNGLVLSEEIFERMIHYTVFVVDRYNDKLLMVSKGRMNLEELLESIDNR